MTDSLKIENGVLRERVTVLEQQLRDSQPVDWDAELKRQVDALTAENAQLKAEQQGTEKVDSGWDAELKRQVDALTAENAQLKVSLELLKAKYREAQNALSVKSAWENEHD